MEFKQPTFRFACLQTPSVEGDHPLLPEQARAVARVVEAIPGIDKCLKVTDRHLYFRLTAPMEVDRPMHQLDDRLQAQMRRLVAEGRFLPNIPRNRANSLGYVWILCDEADLLRDGLTREEIEA